MSHLDLIQDINQEVENKFKNPDNIGVAKMFLMKHSFLANVEIPFGVFSIEEDTRSIIEDAMKIANNNICDETDYEESMGFLNELLNFLQNLG